MLTFDHFAVSADTLAQGVAHVERQIGVAPPPGGTHPRMGTHNHLCGLSNGEYLEVIAIDPDAPDPGRPRWFNLDRRDGPAGIGNWIVRTDDLDAAVARYPGAGVPVALTRGSLRWRMAVPEDGKLPFDGCFPAIIQWDSPPPVFPDIGLSVTRLTVSHPDADLGDILADMIDDPRIVHTIGPTGIRADLDTPDGPRSLA
ncbi:MAG: VOC family protein [Pseudomonadota bacterium]